MAATVVPGDLGFVRRNYISERPGRELANAAGLDRSEVEWGIAKDLLRRGLLPDDVLSWFNHYALVRHCEEYARRKNTRWTENLIAKAERDIESSSSVVETLHPPPKSRNAKVDRRWVIKYVYQHQPVRYTALVEAIRDQSGCSERAAKSNIARGRDLGLVQNTDRGYVLTEVGTIGAEHKGFVTGAKSLAPFVRYIRKQPLRRTRPPAPQERDPTLRPEYT
jgi:hypothetical protein